MRKRNEDRFLQNYTTNIQNTVHTYETKKMNKKLWAVV